MPNQPLISVIMPAHNAEKYIQQSIESVTHQTYQHWELVIVDDGSIDNTAQIINQFTSCDSRIKYFYQSNGKQGKARNTGIKNAAGELIAFLDADDVWFPAKLKQQLHFMNESKADLVFNDIEIIDENGTTLNDSWGVINAVYKEAEGLSAFLQSNKIPALTTLVKKETLNKAGGFVESDEIQYGEDYELWLRLLQQRAVFAGSAEKLGAYRVHASQATERKHAMMQVIKTIHAIKTTDIYLVREKERALKKWIRRFLKSNKLVNKNDLQNIISLYPGTFARFFFLCSQSILGNTALKKVIAISCLEKFR